MTREPNITPDITSGGGMSNYTLNTQGVNYSKKSIQKQQYLKGSAGRAGNYSLNLITGKLNFIKPIISGNGDLLPINLSLYYDNWNNDNYFATYKSKMPKRFRTNYHQVIYKSGSKYYYLDGSGNPHEFLLAVNSTDVYYDRTGTGCILKDFSDYLVIYNGNIRMIFAKKVYSNYYLTHLRQTLSDTAYLELRINYDTTHNITSIVDGMGRTYTFSYSDKSFTITTPKGNSYVFTENANGYLATITEPLNRVSTYTYDSSGRLLTALSDNGEKVVIRYTDDKVSQIIESIISTGHVNTTTELYQINYGNLVTNVTNYKGVLTPYYYTPDGFISGKGSGNEYKYHNAKSVSTSIGKINPDKSMTYQFQEEENIITGNVNSKIVRNFNNNSFLSKGEMTIESGKRYICAICYKLEGALANDNTTTYLYNTLSGEKMELIHGINYERYQSFLIDTSLEGISLAIHHDYSSATLQILGLWLYESEDEEIIAATSGSYSGLAAVGTGKLSSWFKLADITHFVYGENYERIDYPMTYQDILENQRLHALGKNYLWYDNMSKLLFNPGTVQLVFEQVNYPIPLWTMNLGIYLKHKYRGTLVVKEYNTTSGATYFCRQTEKLVSNENTYDNIIETDKVGRVLLTQDYNGVINITTYNTNGQALVEQIKSNQNSQYMKTEYTYTNKMLSKQKVYDADKECETSFVYDSEGNVLSITTPNGQVIDYEYDILNRLVNIKSSASDILNKNEVEYLRDLTKKYTHNTSSSYNFIYDKYNLVSQVSYAGQVLQSITNYIGGRDSQVIDYIDGHREEYEYDKYHRLIMIKEGTDESDIQPILINNYVEDLTVDTGNPQEALYNADAKAKLYEQYDLIAGNTTTYTYDNYGRIKCIDNVSNETQANHINLVYDTWSRLLTQNIEVEDTINYKYRYVYKNNNLSPSDEIVKCSCNFIYTYNEEDYSIIYSQEVTKDNFNRISQLKLVFGNYGLKTCYLYPNCNNITSLYPSRIMYYIGSSSNPSTYVGCDEFTYDEEGNIKTKKSYSSIDNEEAQYTYDKLNRLTKETNNKMGTIFYSYDAGGNIIQKYNDNVTCNYIYDSYKKDRLMYCNGKSITYEVNGNMLSFGSDRYIWERSNLLKSVIKNGKTYSYQYNAKGIRISKILQNNIYVDYKLNGDKIIKERRRNRTTQQTTEIYFNYLGNEIIGFTYQNNHYIYKKNLLGDIMGIYQVTSSGLNLVAKYYYDAWGNHKVCNASGVEQTSESFIGNINPFRYRGYYYDSETGMFWLSARYYSPELCRFISPDSIEYLDPESINGLNLYAYCLNNPVMYVDFTGHSFILIYCGILTTLITTAGISFHTPNVSSKKQSTEDSKSSKPTFKHHNELSSKIDEKYIHMLLELANPDNSVEIINVFSDVVGTRASSQVPLLPYGAGGYAYTDGSYRISSAGGRFSYAYSDDLIDILLSKRIW